MEEKSNPDLLSQLLPDALEQALGLGSKQESPDAGNIFLQQNLQALAGRSGPQVQSAVEEFLEGKGDLRESALSAATRGSGFTEANLADLLEEKFHLSPAVATMFATLLIRLLPSTKKTVKKPRRKPKATTRPKSESSAARKKPKKKAAEKPKKPAKKSAKSSARKPAKKPAPERKTRGETIAGLE